MELKSFYIKASFMSELKLNLEIFLKSNLFNVITISMNLFDQLVIVFYDQVMEG